MHKVVVLPDDNYQDPIVAMILKIFCILAVCGGVMYYYHNYYPYYDIVYKQKETFQITEIDNEKVKYVEEYGNIYVYCHMDGKKVIVDKENAKIVYEDCEPHVEFCEVYKNYKVSSHFLFNLMIALRFDDYSEIVKEEYYLIYIPKNYDKT